MEQKLVSIIIPVYNVEQYLEYCLESVLKQEYLNLEIILVDDGSNDSSGQLCDEYEKRDARVKVIHKENGGLSSARNAGLKIATGDYIAFIDSDDYVRVDYISKMYSFIIQDQSDVVICSYQKVYEEKDFWSIPSKKDEHVLLNREQAAYKMLIGQLPMYAHGKLYKAKLAVNMKFPEGRLFEDVPVTWELVQNVDNVSYVSAEMYFYRQRIDSIVHSAFHESKMDQLLFSEEILDGLSQESALYDVAQARCFFAAADVLTFVTNDYPDQRKYLYNAIKKYRSGALKCRDYDKKTKILALLSYIHPYMVVIIGKIYKWWKFVSIKLSK